MIGLDVPCKVALACVVPRTYRLAEITVESGYKCSIKARVSPKKKKNLPCLRTRARLRGSNEGGQLVLHIAVGGFDAAVRDRAVLRGLHGGPSKTGRANRPRSSSENPESQRMK